MFVFEWITVVYVCGLLAAALATSRLRSTAAIVGLATLAVVGTAASLAPTGVRLWLPLGYLLAGYWLPGLSVSTGRVSRRFETWLARSDARLRPWLPGVPPLLTPLTEVAYLFCYPLVPIACALAWIAAAPAGLERFWTSVLLSAFLSYATLPWLVSRPPRSVSEQPGSVRGVPHLNRLVLGRLSHGWNTFPSGHVAVSWAAAWSLWQIWPAAGAAVALVAAAISVGAAAGGYHYVIDVLAGWLLAVVAGVITW
jgi:membrane-associated phospholipid phosphatase